MSSKQCAQTLSLKRHLVISCFFLCFSELKSHRGCLKDHTKRTVSLSSASTRPLETYRDKSVLNDVDVGQGIYAPGMDDDGQLRGSSA